MYAFGCINRESWSKSCTIHGLREGVQNMAIRARLHRIVTTKAVFCPCPHLYGCLDVSIVLLLQPPANPNEVTFSRQKM
jgi:hypothetical protein